MWKTSRVCELCLVSVSVAMTTAQQKVFKEVQAKAKVRATARGVKGELIGSILQLA